MLKENQTWYIEPTLATLQEIAGLQGPRTCGTTKDPHQSHLNGQRDMPSRYGWRLRWDLDTFYPTEDDFYSMDFALEVLNHTYPGCMGVYLDRAGHILAFYGWKGGSKVGLIQDVAIEAGCAVAEIPTWMGLTAKWKVRLVSLSEANAILAGCKRLEKETQRREHLCYQELLASLHQPSRLSVTAAPFEPQVTLPMPGLAGTSSGPLERQGSGPKAGFSLTHQPTNSPAGKLPPPTRGPYPQTSDDDATSDVGLVDPSSQKKGRRSRGNRGSRGSDSSDGSHSTRSTTTSGGRRKKKDGFSSKIQISEFGGKKGHLGDVTDAF